MQNKVTKKIISCILLVGIMVSVMPNFTFGATIPDSWYSSCVAMFPGTSQWTKEEFNQRINVIADQKNIDVYTDISGYGRAYINPYIYDSSAYFNQLVYGLPSTSDAFIEKSTGHMMKDGKKGEYKFIGYDRHGNKLTNDLYSAGTVNPDKKFRDYGVNGIDKVTYTQRADAERSWHELNQVQKDYMKTSVFYDDDFHLGDSVPTGFTLQQIFGANIEKYVYVQSPIGVWTGASAVFNNSLIGWNTVMFKQMKTFEPSVSVTASETNVVLKNGQNEKLIKVSVIANISGEVPLEYFDRIVFKFEGQEQQLLKNEFQSGKYTYTKEFYKTIRRSDLVEGQTKSYPLNANIEVYSFIPDERPKYASSSTMISATAEPNLEPYAEATLSLEYDHTFKNKDVPIGRKLNYELKNKPYGTYVTKVEIQYAGETKINVAPAAEKGQNYTKITVPKGEFNAVNEVTKKYEPLIVFTLNTGKQIFATASAAARIYKVQPTPPAPTPTPQPTPIPNNDPIVKVYLPTQVRAGELVTTVASISDEDGDDCQIDGMYTDGATVVKSMSNSRQIYWKDEYIGKLQTVQAWGSDSKGGFGYDEQYTGIIDPYVTASISVTGQLKENRSIILSVNEDTPYYHPIVSRNWTITPVSGGATAAAIKYVDNLTERSIDVLFKTAGVYKATVTGRNDAGYTYSVERTITISPDEIPTAVIDVAAINLREPEHGYQSEIITYNTSYSKDNDTIGSAILRCRYDSDNDGSFDDESFVTQYNGINKNIISFLKPKPGKYQIEFEIKESFTVAPELASFVNASDYKTHTTTIEFEIQNIAPYIGLNIEEKPSVDLHIAIGLSDYTIPQVQTQINSILKPYLASKGIDANVTIDKKTEYSIDGVVVAAAGGFQGMASKVAIVDIFGQVFIAKTNGSRLESFYPVDFGKIANKKVKDITGGLWYYDLPNDYDEIYDPSRFLAITEDNCLYLSPPNSWSDWIYITDNVKYAELGSNSILILKNDGSVYYQGKNDYGMGMNFAAMNYWISGDQVYGSSSPATVSLKKLPFTEKMIDIAIGNRACAAVTENGEVYTWGYNYSPKTSDNKYYNNNPTAPYFGEASKLPNKSNITRIAFQQYDTYEHGDWLNCYTTGTHADKQRFFANLKLINNDKKIVDLHGLGMPGSFVFRLTPEDKKYGKDSSYKVSSLLSEINFNSDSDGKFLLWLADDEIRDLRDNNLLQSCKNLLDGVSFIGGTKPEQSSNYASFISNVGCEGVYYDNTNLQTLMNNVARYIENSVSIEGDKSVVDYITVGKGIEISTYYSDYENDPIHSMQFQVVHNPNYFDNSIGTDPQSGKILTTLPSAFNYTGEYTLTLQARDNPVNNNAFDNYRKVSNPFTMKLYVHRKPIPNAKVTVSKSYPYNVTYWAAPYDLDHTSRSDKGIIRKTWYYKKVTDTEWIKGQLTTINPTDKYLVKYVVMDLELATAEQIIPLEVSSANLPPIAGFSLNKYSLKNTETLVATSTAYDPENGPLTYTWVTQKDGVTIHTGTGLNGYKSTFTSTEKGTYTLTQTVTDDMGQSDSYTLSYTIFADNTPPVVTISPMITPWQKNNIAITITATDLGNNASGVATVSYRFSDKEGVFHSEFTTESLAIKNLTLSNEGEWYIQAYATDREGNVSDIVTGGPYQIDLSEPEIAANYIAGARYIDVENKIYWSKKDDTQYWNVIGKDKLSGMYEIYHAVSDGVTTHWATFNKAGIHGKSSNQTNFRYVDSINTRIEDKSMSAYFQLRPQLLEGVYPMSIRATDNVGLTKLKTIEERIGVDNRGPVITPSITSHERTNNPISIHIEFDDAGVGFSHAEYKLTNSVNVPTSWETTYDDQLDILIDKSGKWYLHIRAYDRLNNVTTLSEPFGAYEIELDGPTITFSPDGCDWRNTDLPVSITATPNTGSITELRIKVTNSQSRPYFDWDITTASDSHTLTLDQEGLWFIHAEAQDDVGNITYSCSEVYRIDKTRPELTMGYVDGASYISGNNYYVKRGDIITFWMQGVDALSGMWRLLAIARDGTTNPYRGALKNNSYPVYGTHDRIRINEPIITINNGNTLKAEFPYEVLTSGDYIFDIEGIADDNVYQLNGSTPETNLYNRHGWVDIGYRLITDNTPPEIGVDKEDGLCVIRAAIKITATDTGAGVKRITYAWSDAETPPAAGWTIVESDTATAIEEDEGIWYLHIRSTDNVDNVSSIVTYGPYEVIHMSASDFKVTQIYDLAWREYYFDMSNGTDTNNDGEPDTFPKHSNTDIITTQMPINKSGLVSYIREGIKPGYKFEGEVTVIGEPDTVRFIINYYINGNRNTDIIQCSHAGEDKFTYEWIVPLETDKHSFIEFNLEAIKGEETFGNEVWLDEWPEGNISRRVMYVVDGSALDDLLFIQSQ